MECIKCGKASEIDVFCTSCYVPKVKLPKKTLIQVCKSCARYRIGGKWVAGDPRKVEDYLAKKIKGEFKEAFVDLESGEAVVVVESSIGDVEYVFPIDVQMEVVLCRECSKMRGSYYEALLQLRGDSRKVEKYARLFKKLLLKKTFITKEEEMHGGLDIYIGSSRALMEALGKLGIKNYKLSRTLHTAKEGKRIYRLTVSVRF